MELLYGLITGILFGFLMQRGQVLRYDKQIAALRLQDFTIFKFMLSHILVAMIGIYILKDMGLVKLSLKTMTIGGVVFGGLIFGVGWSLLGYCPGTSVGAVGEGRLDALWGVAGMLAGAGLYAELYPWVQKSLLNLGNYGKITLPDLFGLNHWIVIIGFSILILSFFYGLEKAKK
ncbi:MAG: YeeE/YedE family protein [Negativicutes bacterium]|nr:YeeE/YedE family protein [Negativicutes bacterium]